MLAYMPKEKDSPESILYEEMFDKTVYPDIESVPRRFAILKRNKCMVDKSDFRTAKQVLGTQVEEKMVTFDMT